MLQALVAIALGGLAHFQVAAVILVALALQGDALVAFPVGEALALLGAALGGLAAFVGESCFGARVVTVSLAAELGVAALVCQARLFALALGLALRIAPVVPAFRDPPFGTATDGFAAIGLAALLQALLRDACLVAAGAVGLLSAVLLAPASFLLFATHFGLAVRGLLARFRAFASLDRVLLRLAPFRRLACFMRLSAGLLLALRGGTTDIRRPSLALGPDLRLPLLRLGAVASLAAVIGLLFAGLLLRRSRVLAFVLVLGLVLFGPAGGFAREGGYRDAEGEQGRQCGRGHGSGKDHEACPLRVWCMTCTSRRWALTGSENRCRGRPRFSFGQGSPAPVQLIARARSL